MTLNRQIRLAARPVGLPRHGDWQFTEEPVREPGAGEVLIKVLYLSLDPAMRGWMTDSRSYLPPVALGEVMRAGGAGKVIASGHPGFAVGDHVTGFLGTQEYAISDGSGELTRIDTRLAPLPVHLGTLGGSGKTAYFGLLEVGQASAGDTVVVSAAAGSVGSVVGQIAKIKGCRAIGIAGGPDKCRWLVDELGFDAAIDYKNEDVGKALKRHCPKGIDVYFDSVGGDILDAALARLARGARVVICGAISQADSGARPKGPSNYMSLLVNRATMKGMVSLDYADRFEQAVQEMAGWIREGKLNARVESAEGLENFPEALLRLFRGQGMGKLVLRIAEETPGYSKLELHSSVPNTEVSAHSQT